MPYELGKRLFYYNQCDAHHQKNTRYNFLKIFFWVDLLLSHAVLLEILPFQMLRDNIQSFHCVVWLMISNFHLFVILRTA